MAAWAENSMFVAGRDVEEKRDFRIRGVIGSIIEMEGFVQETTRAFYDATDQEFKQDLAERFDLNDFNIDGGFATVGLSTETIWTYFTLQFDLLAMNPETDTVARRNYYIDVDDVSFNGRSFENMQIPEGTRIKADLAGALVELNGLYTPFTFEPNDSVLFTPWVGLGLFLFFGAYDIDAGPPQGVIQYQFPPEDFVVGGSADGFIGGGMPELGLGGELILGRKEEMNLIIQGHVGFFSYDGSTRYVTTSEHRDKDADIDHLRARVQVSAEFPLESGRVITLGGQFETIDSEATIESEPGTEDEIIARRERFDKEIEFKMTTGTAFVGLTF